MSDILLQGLDIAKLLRSDGPIVKGVLLRATENHEESKPAAVTTTTAPDTERRVILADLIDEVQVDTTPKKSMVAHILGGPFTFLGQYEDEGIVLMCRKSQQEGPLNPHQLQPPLTDSGVRGDILILKVAPTEKVLDDDDDDDGDHEKAVVVPTNDEFFLDYTKEEYIAFASRTDVVAPEMEQCDNDEEEEEEEKEEIEEEVDDEYSGEEEEEEDDDEDDSGSQVAMMNLIMGQVLRRFHEENGRGPDTQELLELRSALAEKIGVEVPEVHGADWDQKASTRKTEAVVDKNPGKPVLTKKRAVEDDEPGVEEEEKEQEAKRVKFSEHDELKSAAADVTGGNA